MIKLRRLLILSAFLSVAHGVSYGQQLIANWAFNENDGTTTTDLENGIVGTFVGDATWSDDAFQGTSVLLDGDGDYVETDSADLLNTVRNADNFTITAYFKANHLTGGQQHIFWIGNTAGNGWGPESEINISIGHFNAAFTNPLLTAYYGSGDVGDPDQIHMVFPQPETLDSSDWHHVAFVVSDAGIENAYGEFYLDGTYLTPMTTDETGYAQSDLAGDFIIRSDWNSGVLVGVGGNKTQRYFDGRIDNVRVYDYNLNSSEINDDLIASASSVFADKENAVFPNPVQGTMLYLRDFTNIVSAEIISIDGKVQDRIVVNSASIYLSDLNSGIYFLRTIDANGNSVVHKFVKQ